MQIHSASFVISSPNLDGCPQDNFPEYAFIGRSNVGKSTLINMLTNSKNLVKTSSKPGKTQLINHFLINNQWFLVDLPGYGYAKSSKKKRKEWQQFTQDYLLQRKNLMNLFILIDSRIPLQKIDLDFMIWCAEKQLPFTIVFTKADKISSSKRNKNIASIKRSLKNYWDPIPPNIVSSGVSKLGREELLASIETTNKLYPF